MGWRALLANGQVEREKGGIDMLGELSRRTAIAAIAAAPIAATAKTREPAMLRVGDRLPRFDLMRPGAKTYLISTSKDGRHNATNIWRREIRFEHGKLRIVQHWDGGGSNATVVDRDSLFDPRTFLPPFPPPPPVKPGP